MGLVPTLKTFVSGTAILASEVNQNFASIVAVVNGGIDNSNISQISAGKVTSGEFDPDRIPRLSEDKLPQAAQGFLKAKGATADPAYELVQWGDVQSKPAQATRWPAWGEVADKPTTATRWPTWGEVTSKPSTFPPSAHSASLLTSGTVANARLPTTATRWPTWGEVTSKPSTFPPSAHTHSWESITNKPSSYPPSAHSANLLTSGTVPIERIAVGATNNTQVAPGQGGTAAVGALRLLGIGPGYVGNIVAGTTYTAGSGLGSRLDFAHGNVYNVPIGGENFIQFAYLRGDPVPTGQQWQALADATNNTTSGSAVAAFLAVRIS